MTTIGLVVLAALFPLITLAGPLVGEAYVLGKLVLLMIVPAILLLVVRGSVSVAWRKDSSRWWAPAIVIVVWTLLSQVAPWNPGFGLAGVDPAFVLTAAIATAITAGVGEELFYRRWLQTRLEALLGAGGRGSWWPLWYSRSCTWAPMELVPRFWTQPASSSFRLVQLVRWNNVVAIPQPHRHHRRSYHQQWLGRSRSLTPIIEAHTTHGTEGDPAA